MEKQYPIKLTYDPADGEWLATVPDLSGCTAFGDTPEDAVHEAGIAIDLWLDAARQIGKPVPEPHSADDYSGKIAVRGPRSLHRDLVDKAREEGVSLNQMVLYILSSGVGHPLPESPDIIIEPGKQHGVLKVPGRRRKGRRTTKKVVRPVEASQRKARQKV